jgi:hypothetical protein
MVYFSADWADKVNENPKNASNIRAAFIFIQVSNFKKRE